MEWHFLNNQFINATDGSFRLMLTLTNDHFAKLQAQQADPDILDLLNRTDPVHNAFLDGYSSWKSALGSYKGGTALTDSLIEQLSSTKARNWDTKIMDVYDKGTPEHLILFPNGRTPFQSGTIDERVAAVKTLGESLNSYASLATVKTDVDGFHTTLKNARDGQQVKEQLSKQSSTDLELARINIGIMMYRNLGSLMDKFGSAPDNVLNYFDVSLIKAHNTGKEPDVQEFMGPVLPMTTVNITSAIAANADVIITNTGTVMLKFCAAPDANTACVVDTLDLAPGGIFQAKGSDFSNSANQFLNVTNNDPGMEGSYNVEVVTPG